MLDFVTAHVPLTAFSEFDVTKLLSLGDRVMRYCPSSGDVRYITTAWDSIRSDSHGLNYRVGTDLWVQGSPARCIGSGESVFSSGASAAEDVVGCLDRMIAMLYSHLDLETRPDVDAWDVCRVDVTRNLLLDSLPEVRQALAFLRNAEGGRLRVYQPDGDTVYWNKNSRYKKGKAYAKGPHLRYQMGQKKYTGYRYTDEEIEQAQRLLRLELTIFKRQWQKNLGIDKWQELTPAILGQQWQEYFSRLMGSTIMNDEELKERIEAVAPTVGQAKAAYTMWYLVKSMGWELAKESHTSTTWYRNLKILKESGLTVTDIGNGKVIPFRVQKLVLGREVCSWSDLRKAA